MYFDNNKKKKEKKVTKPKIYWISFKCANFKENNSMAMFYIYIYINILISQFLEKNFWRILGIIIIFKMTNRYFMLLKGRGF